MYDMAGIGDKIDGLLKQRLWKTDTATVSKTRAVRIRALRLVYIIIKGLSEEQLILRAMSLVYTSLLTFVPLLAVSFSVLKAFGVHTRFLIFLYYFLEPLGESGVDLSMKIIGFVENVKVSVLGSIGLSALVFTVISTIQKLEGALNYIWNIRASRGFSERFSNYMSVLLVGPVLVFSAIGITTTMMSSAVMKNLMEIRMLGPVIYMISWIMPYLLITAAFTMIYIFLPNTKVGFRPALAGGFAAALLWQSISWVFTSFVASSAKYSAIYSGFASLILFLIWLYWNFLTLLIGARVSYYTEHPQLLDAGSRIMSAGDRHIERIALVIMFLVGSSFHWGRKHWQFESLSHTLGIPSEVVSGVLSSLQEKGLLAATQGEPPEYLPAKDLGAITLNEIIAAARMSGEDAASCSEYISSIPEINGIMDHMEQAIAQSLDGQTLQELVRSAGMKHQ